MQLADHLGDDLTDYTYTVLKALAIELVACAAGGFYCGLTHTAVIGLTFGLPVVGSFLCFSGLTTANFVNGCISVALGFALALIGMLILYKDEER